MKRLLIPLIAFATFTGSANAGQTKWVKSVLVPRDDMGFLLVNVISLEDVLSESQYMDQYP